MFLIGLRRCSKLIAFRGGRAFARSVGLISHNETKVLPFKGQQLQSVIRDVDNYGKFLPFCTHSRIHSLISPTLTETEGAFVTDLGIGFMAIECSYLSDVHYRPGQVRISRNETDTMFHVLDVIWDIENLADARCRVAFNIKLQLRSSLYNYTVGMLKDLLVYKMNQAFIDRTYAVYGPQNDLVRACSSAKPRIYSSSSTRFISNLSALKESKKIGPTEFEELMLLLGSHFCELETIDNAYGGSQGCEDLYVASLRKLMGKYRQPQI